MMGCALDFDGARLAIGGLLMGRFSSAVLVGIIRLVLEEALAAVQTTAEAKIEALAVTAALSSVLPYRKKIRLDIWLAYGSQVKGQVLTSTICATYLMNHEGKPYLQHR